MVTETSVHIISSMEVVVLTHGTILITKRTHLPVTPVLFRATLQPVLSQTTITGITKTITRTTNEVGCKVTILIVVMLLTLISPSVSTYVDFQFDSNDHYE
jgi:hypothetical protein